ncbi:MAG TPA: hypothetical protein PLQ78_03110 [Flavipsychrobacter sp.]|nr:hypothetical protein [Flavipsychrobacter sp.]
MSLLKHTIFRQAPLLFILVAVFHIAITLFSIYLHHDLAFTFIDWQTPLLTLAYCILWVFVCTMKKWAAYSYVLLTVCSGVLQFVLVPKLELTSYDASLFPVDMVFSVIILAYFKKFS